MSPKQNQSPVKMIISDEFYEAIAQRRASQGLPPAPDRSSFISESQARAEAEARARQRAANAAPAVLPRPGWAVRSILKSRRESIDGFERHSRKCRLCRHPRLEEIENAYLNWHSAYDICRVFQIDDPDALYRHARAARLDATRRGNVRHVVEHFIEQAHNVKITSSTVLRSIRALSCLDDKGRWTDLPKTHILIRSAYENACSTETGIAGSGSSSSSEKVESRSVGSPSSFERSEPFTKNVRFVGGAVPMAPKKDEDVSGSPEVGSVAASHTVFSANESNVGEFPSFERSEPQYRRISASASRGREENGASSLSTERREPEQKHSAADSNRVSMGN